MSGMVEVNTIIIRPERRFGRALISIGTGVDGQRYSRRWSDGAWVPIEIGSDLPESHLLFLEDSDLEQIATAWREENPQPVSDPRAEDLLHRAWEDACRVRDRLLTMLEKHR